MSSSVNCLRDLALKMPLSYDRPWLYLQSLSNAVCKQMSPKSQPTPHLFSSCLSSVLLLEAMECTLIALARGGSEVASKSVSR